MKKWIPIVLAIIAVIAVVAIVFALINPAKEEQVLNIYTWAEYIDQDTILTPFTAETGIKINYVNFSSNEEMLAKMQVTGGGEFDLVLSSDFVLDALRQQELLQPLNKSLIPNFANIKAGCLNQNFDPESKYVVPYIYGVPTIVYDPAKVGFEITGYEDLWNPALKDSVVLIDDARVIIGITLISMGYPMNTTDPAILDQAAEKMKSLRANIRVFDYDTPHVQLLSNEVSVGFMFTPQAVAAHTERPDFQVVFPKEGLGFGIDGFVIPAKAQHVENAHKFLDFLLRPEIGVAIAEVQGYNNINQASEASLPESYRTEPALNPPEEMLPTAQYIEYMGIDETKFQEIWTAFKQQ